jgi:class 3 adenylate cyclase/tetratricopeptide (TPR) repeat protein
VAGIETLTVLFTDLVDSTSRRVQAGEEQAERMRLHHDRLVRAAVVANGGTIAKHTGDGVMATFTGASEAVAAAVAVQQSIDADNRRSNTPPAQLRIGISSGDVSVENNDCFGLPVIEAQRLEAAAEGGQILASSLVKALARGRGGFEFRSIGALTLKGLDGPLDADEILWEPLRQESAAEELPPTLRDRSGFGFAGRVKERELLAGAWQAVATGATRLVLLAGEPGIGKTRLTTELARSIGDDAIVLAGRSDELVSLAYQPFVEALRWHLTLPSAFGTLGSAAGELTRLVPELADLVPDLPPPLESTPDAERLRLFDAVRDWLAATTAERPLLLVLDDLHWADEGSLLLLRHVVAIDAIPRLMVVATYRDTDLDRTHPLSSMLADFRRRSDVTRVALEGLDEREVTDLLSAAAGHDLDEAGQNLATNVREETGGNPFFVGEVLRHLAESGAIEQRDGRWTAGPGGTDVPLPEGIRDVIGRRLSVLPDATQHALGVASVIGLSFGLPLLSRVSKRSEDELIDDLEPAMTASLVAETGIERYQFSHALVASVLRQELSTTRRARLHRGIAEALMEMHAADTDAVVAELAYHFGEAGAAIPNDQAIVFARRAAELAYERPAPDEAARWYRHVLELLDGEDPVVEADVLCRLALAEMAGGIESALETQLRAARAAEAVGDLRLMTEALRISRRGVFAVGSAQPVNHEKIELLERALAAVPEPELELRGLLTASLATEILFTGDLDRRDDLVTETIALSEQVADPDTSYTIRATAAMGGSRAVEDRAYYDSVQVLLETRIEWARSVGDKGAEARVLQSLYFGALVTGDGPGRRRRDREFDECLQQFPHPLYADQALLRAMMQALIDGEIAHAELLAADVRRQWGAHGMGDGETYAISGELQAARERFGLGPMVDAIAAAGVESEGVRPDVFGGLTALALTEAGRFDDANALVDAHVGNDFADLIDDAALQVARSAWADVVATTRHERGCEAFIAILRPLHDIHQVTGGWYLGSTTRYLGRLAAALGRHDEADEWFAQAVVEHERIESPTWLARTQLDWADEYLRRGDGARARELASQALDVIGTLELDHSRARATAILDT